MNREPWILLRVRGSPAALTVDAQADDGTRATPDRSSAGLELRIPLNLATLVADALVRLHATHAVSNAPAPARTLAVFLDVPESLAGIHWESLLLPHLGVAAERIAFVRLTPRRWIKRPFLRLPIRILAVGTGALARFDEIRDTSWYRDALVRAYGMQIDFADPRDLATDLRRRDYDLVVGGEAIADVIRDTPQVLPRAVGQRPRVLLLQRDPGSESLRVSLPVGVAVLDAALQNTMSDTSLVTEFVYGIVHDQPLHEVVRAASAVMPAGAPMELIADPVSNQSLRLSSALSAFQDEAAELSVRMSAGDVHGFARRLADKGMAHLPATERLLERLRRAAEYGVSVAKARHTLRNLGVNFLRETTGLAPLAHAEAELAAAQHVVPDLERELAAIAADDEAREVLHAAQQRRADVTMDEFTENAWRPIESRNRSLIAGSRYRVCVDIGNGNPHSLLKEPAPAIDPLLPPATEEQGHTLEIALIEKDFELRSRRVQTVFLPALGGIAPVKFEVAVPEKHTGAIDCRIGIYHDNHLLQSFRLDAVVTPVLEWGVTQPIQATLDFTRTERFTNIDRLGGRLVSLGVNANGGSHSIWWKQGSSASGAVRISEGTIEDQVTKFRGILERHTFNGKQPRFPIDLLDQDAPPSPAFEDAIRELAVFGSELYGNVSLPGITADRELEAVFDAVRNATDGTIQVVRHDPNYSYPWAVMYDRPIPLLRAGQAPPRVCVGKPFTTPPSTQDHKVTAGCPHNPGEDVYCVSGFWGVRLRIEQLIAAPEHGDALPVVRRPSGRQGVYAAYGMTDQAVQQLEADLGRALKPTDLGTLSANEALLDLLWDAGRRPALLMVIGHYETRPIAGEPAYPRLRLVRPGQPAAAVPQDHWLLTQQLLQYLQQRKSWKDEPQPIVLLMACSSASTSVTTLNDFVKTLSAAGAAAVVGTEATVFSGLAARFARDVTTAIWNDGVSLGEAVRRFYQETTSRGIPLAFAFTSCGSADLTIQ